MSHIRAVDGVFHVMRAFDEPEVIHVEDRVDPIADIEIITNELRQKDLELIDKVVVDLKKGIARGLKKARCRGRALFASTTVGNALEQEQKEELASAEKVLAWLQAGKDVRNGMEEWNLKDVDFLNEKQLLSAKPVTFLVNLSPEDYARKKNKWLPKIAEWVATHGAPPFVPRPIALALNISLDPNRRRQDCALLRQAGG